MKKCSILVVLAIMLFVSVCHVESEGIDMARIKTDFYCELTSPVKVQYLHGNVFSMDNNANTLNVFVTEDGQPVTLTGSISADVVRADGGTVTVTGSSSGNQATVVLPQACYAVPGVISIVIKNTVDSDVTTLCAVVANVYQSSTDTVVDPGTIIPSIQALITQIETAVASIPADYSSLWTSLAPAFDNTKSYVAGQYVTYSGGLYRFTTAHSGSWAAGDVTAVNIGGELSDVKSAFYHLDYTDLLTVIKDQDAEKLAYIPEISYVYDGSSSWKFVDIAVPGTYESGDTITIRIDEGVFPENYNGLKLYAGDGTTAQTGDRCGVGYNTRTLNHDGLKLRLNVSSDSYHPSAGTYYAKGIHIYSGTVKAFDPVELIEEVDEKVEDFAVYNQSANLLNPANIIDDGYYMSIYGTLSASPNFVRYELNVTPGQTLSFAYQNNVNSSGNPGDGLIYGLVGRFITAFNSGGSAVSASGAESATSYTVPTGITKIVISFNKNTYKLQTNHWMIVVGDRPTTVIDYYTPYYSPGEIMESILNPYDVQYGAYVTGNLAAAGKLTIEENHIKNGKHFCFDATVTTMGTFKVCHGYNSYGASWLEIDGTNIKAYAYTTSSTLLGTFAHGLTIASDIQVTIDVGESENATVRLCSGGEWYSCTISGWTACRGDVFIESENAVFANCKASFTANGYAKKIQMYGDSYFGTTSSDRWVYYLVQDNHSKNALIDGYAGCNSSSAITSFINNIKHSKPDFVVWCLGMNDPDSSSAISNSWKTNVELLISTCERYGITPILATIPTVSGGSVDDSSITSLRINKFKNEYIRESGYRYIDFNAAVGANDTTGEWYTGMLSSDGVHPTAKGAKALYLRVLTDFPEVAMDQ